MKVSPIGIVGGAMKVFLLLFLSALVSVSFAKNDADFKNFNKKMTQKIQQVLDENPHLYETKPINRGPASVQPSAQNEEPIQKLDDVEEQADTHINW